MWRIVPVIEARLGKNRLVSGRRYSLKSLDPHADHPSFLQIDVVGVLQTNSLLFSEELKAIGAKGRLS